MVPRKATARERKIAERQACVMPLDEFPAAKRAEIERAIAAPKPPPRWLDLGLAQIESRAWIEWHWARGVDPHDRKRLPLPRHLRLAVIERDGYVCGLCGEDVAPRDLHIDHIRPYSQGGEHRLDNLQVTHAACNLRKGARV